MHRMPTAISAVAQTNIPKAFPSCFAIFVALGWLSVLMLILTLLVESLVVGLQDLPVRVVGRDMPEVERSKVCEVPSGDVPQG